MSYRGVSFWTVQVEARIAYWHARHVYSQFLKLLEKPELAQTRALQESLSLVSDSDFGRRHDLKKVRSLGDLRRAVPISRYEELRPYVQRVMDGDRTALFRTGVRPLMFATSSGTEGLTKYVPVTKPFVDDYRRGWNTFGLKMLSDHPAAICRCILQSSGRYDETHAGDGTPCGAITGLLARTQKKIVRRYYTSPPGLAYIDDVTARYYATMRSAIEKDVAFAITANPSTLIRLARTMDERKADLIRDVRDGAISPGGCAGKDATCGLGQKLRPNPRRASQLESIVEQTGQLLPRDAWRLEFLSCWTGGSMGHYLPAVRALWGGLPIRDPGLLASEGRVSIPFNDDSASGVLDVRAACFEFIPQEEWESREPQTLGASQLERDHQYIVVLTNRSGLVRYRLDDVVRVTGHLGRTPVLEFIRRAGSVVSMAGEKLTENQVVKAVERACQRAGAARAPGWARCNCSSCHEIR